MTDTERERINAICEVAGVAEIDDLSDGFHTFRQLYYQRMMLFATIVKQNKDKAWKSLRHEDGELCFGGGWFIVGIDTPEGSYTYHYENMYFDLFDCEILDYGKHWDGHTEKDVTRLLSLQDVPDTNVGDIISRQVAIDAVDAIGHIATMPDGDKCIRRSAVKYTLSMLPPAQPKKRTEKHAETHACDSIGRQAAEPTLKQVELYCKRRCLTVISDEMLAKLIEERDSILAGAIPVAWINAKIESMKGTDNMLAELTADVMATALNEWRKELEGKTT